MANKPYIGDIGTIIEIDMGEDISFASLVELHVKKSGSGALAKWVGTIYNNNFIRYTTIEGDFDQSGVYLINPYIEIGSWKGYGELALSKEYKFKSFYVYKKHT